MYLRKTENEEYITYIYQILFNNEPNQINILKNVAKIRGKWGTDLKA